MGEAKTTKITKSQQIFNEVRNQILLGRVKPGELIGEIALASEFGASRTPVRQALQKLQAIGLVEIRDGAGSFVTSASIKEMEDAYQIRCALEKVAVETAVYHVAPEELDGLEARFCGFLSQLESGEGIDSDALAFADWELHDLLVDKSDNELISATVERVTALLRRYQISQATGQIRATREHLSLIRCLREGNVEGAQQVLEAHLKVRLADD